MLAIAPPLIDWNSTLHFPASQRVTQRINAKVGGGGLNAKGC
jgi:hypothetical protein